MGTADLLFQRMTGYSDGSKKAQRLQQNDRYRAFQDTMSMPANNIKEASKIRMYWPEATSRLDTSIMPILNGSEISDVVYDGLGSLNPTSVSVMEKTKNGIILKYGQNVDKHIGKRSKKGTLSHDAAKEASPNTDKNSDYELRSSRKGNSFMVIPATDYQGMIRGVLNVSGDGFGEEEYTRGKIVASMIAYHNMYANNPYQDQIFAFKALSRLYRDERDSEKQLLGEMSKLFKIVLKNDFPDRLKENLCLTFKESMLQNNIYIAFENAAFITMKRLSKNRKKLPIENHHRNQIVDLASRVRKIENQRKERRKQVQIITQRYAGVSQERWNHSYSSTFGD
ncbi:hypothetical protein GF323_04620 [Candidatus Woesearchaeota archaeon]|nr:hypothetical protein [Candidatus Woesearchaeota archaeon]